jgi:protein-S-isoprenylcysteine O-methyltransferase Ste14
MDNSHHKLNEYRSRGTIIVRRGQLKYGQLRIRSQNRLSGVRIPIPWEYTIGYLLGVGAQFIVPFGASSVTLIALFRVLGILLVALGTVLMVWPQSIFRKYHTTTIPYETTTTFVSWGPYRFSRNPMYLGLFLFFAGLSVIFVFVWSILALFVVVYHVNSRVIPMEEKQLRKSFGDVYEQYCKRVRRWL